MQFRTLGWTAATIGTGLLPGTAAAQTLDLSVEIPRIRVAEYHRPYVAIWLEKKGVTPRTIQVWYDVGAQGGKGAKWLREVRQWWRASGRAMRFPADGVSGATRHPGQQKLKLVGGRGGMPVLTPGSYTLVVEAAREAGGRELLRLPLTWNGSTVSAQAKGKTELGAVAATLSR